MIAVSARTTHVGSSTDASSRKGMLPQRLLSLLIALVLAFSLAPAATLAHADEPDSFGDGAALLREEALSDEGIARLLDAGPYEEGSALVVVDNTVGTADGVSARGADLLEAAEPLMDASAAALEQVAGTAEEAGVSPLASNDAGEGDVSIKLVRADYLSTDELIRTLRDDPRVIAVEPNYTYELVDPSESNRIDVSAYADDALASSGSASQATPYALGDADDMTAYQWGYSADLDVMKVAGQTMNLDMNIPLWSANRTDSSVKNATGTVAILDTGIDYTHPDLAPVMRSDMQSFVSYGSASGYAPASADGDPMDDHGHGTHVAGIVAARWDDSGISGIASGAYLVAVKAGDARGGFGMDNVIAGYAYLSDAVHGGLNLVSINNSWGGPSTTYSLSLAITELGRLGAVSVFASGNESLNTDNSPQTVSSLRSNPYAVVVDSATRYSEPSSFTNYGVATTDVFAPGSKILSTHPMSMASYFPEACDSNTLFETFTDGDPASASVLVFPNRDASLSVGTVQNGAQFDTGGGALAVSLADLTPVSARELNGYVSVGAGSLSVADVENFGWRYYTDGSPQAAALAYVLVVDEHNQEHWLLANQTTAGRSISDDWMVESFNLAEACAAHGVTPKMENGAFMLRIRLLSPSVDWDLSKSFYLDAVGVAPTGVEIAYDYKDGTSMASPAVAGAAAIAAVNDGGGLDSSEAAAERAMRLRASVTPVASMADLCASGGAVDLAVLDTADMVPVVLSAQVTDQASGTPSIAISGGYYGAASGTVTIGGAAASVKTWSHNRIEVECPAGIASGVHTVRVENAAGKAGQRALALELPAPPAQEGTPLYEAEYALPPLSSSPHEAMDHALIAGLEGKLYLIPRTTESLTAKELWALDPKTGTWERCADIPQELYSPTVAAYEKTLIIGGSYENAAGEQVTSLFRFDPASGAWSPIDIALHESFSLANVGGTLLAVGGFGVGEDDLPLALDTVTVLDVDAKTSTVVGHLETALMSPDVAVGGSTLAVGMGTSFDEEGQAHTVRGFARYTYEDGRLVGGDDDGALPAFGPEGANPYALAVVRDGIVSVGFSAVDSNTEELEDEDTYLLGVSIGGESSAETMALASATQFEGYGKRFMRGQVYNHAVCAYDGQVYALGYANGGSDGWVLRSTGLATMPAAGDVIHGSDPTPTPTPTPTALPGPDASGLASTGDGMEVPVLAGIGAALFAALALALSKRRIRLG